MIKLNHVAVASQNPERLQKLFLLLGVIDQGTEKVASQKLDATFYLANPALTALELLVPNDAESTVQAFIDKRGGGIHHLSFEVDSGELDALTAQLKENGYQMTYEIARPGAHGMRVNFIHPKCTGGILIEVSEKA